MECLEFLHHESTNHLNFWMNQLSTISWKSWYLWYVARTASSCHWYAKRPNGPILWAFWRIDGGWVMAEKNTELDVLRLMSGVSLVIVLIHHQGWRDAWWFVMMYDDTWWYMMIHGDLWWMMHAQWSCVNVSGSLVVLEETVSWHSGMWPSPVLEWIFGYSTLGSLWFSNDLSCIWSLKCRKNWCFWVEVAAKRNVLNFQWSAKVIRWVFSRLSDFNVNDWEVGYVTFLSFFLKFGDLPFKMAGIIW